MKLQVNRYRNLVISDERGTTWIIGGVKCDTSEVNERTMVMGAANKCYSNRDILDFDEIFSFTLAINDYK